jgi:hypothetical protein
MCRAAGMPDRAAAWQAKAIKTAGVVTADQPR